MLSNGCYDKVSVRFRVSWRCCARVPKVNVAGLLIFHLFSMQCVCRLPYSLCAVWVYDECACEIKRNKELRNKTHTHSQPRKIGSQAFAAYRYTAMAHGREGNTRKMKVCDRTKERRRNSYTSAQWIRYSSRFSALYSSDEEECSGVLCTLALDIYLRPFIIVTITSQELFLFFFSPLFIRVDTFAYHSLSATQPVNFYL